jgi:pimeloyl-ACP methyl ester carboxylesterase
MDAYRLPSADEVAPRAWAGLAVVAAASFVATLDAMVLYVAFGSIRRDVPGVSAAALSWILATTIVVPGAAHMIPITHPQAVVDAVRSDAATRNQQQVGHA